jgi:hypothetical protein
MLIVPVVEIVRYALLVLSGTHCWDHPILVVEVIRYSLLRLSGTHLLRSFDTIKFEHFCDEVETNFRRHRVVFATQIIFFFIGINSSV